MPYTSMRTLQIIKGLVEPRLGPRLCFGCDGTTAQRTRLNGYTVRAWLKLARDPRWAELGICPECRGRLSSFLRAYNVRSVAQIDFRRTYISSVIAAVRRMHYEAISRTKVEANDLLGW